jgi:hypothetical protein
MNLAPIQIHHHAYSLVGIHSEKTGYKHKWLQTAEMKYLRRTAGYTLLNHKRNKEILEQLHVTPLEDK